MNPSNERPVAFWCREPSRPNFGDALTPWLIKTITGRWPDFASPADARTKVFVTGSIIGLAGPNCVVWGSGVMTRHDLISRDSVLRAVRGPVTRARALECGCDCPEVYGDPALLLPRWVTAHHGSKRGVAVAPHFSDLPRVAAAWQPSTELRLINMQSSVESVVEAITASELVITSSLHALIVSHAYGIPAVWVQLRPLPSGDGSKFHDHQLSVGLEPQPAIRIDHNDFDADGLARWAQLPESIDTAPLWAACPLRGVA